MYTRIYVVFKQKRIYTVYIYDMTRVHMYMQYTHNYVFRNSMGIL